MPRADLSNLREFNIIVIGYRNYSEDHKTLYASPTNLLPTEYLDGDQVAAMYTMTEKDGAKAARAFTKSKFYRKDVTRRFMLENEVVIGVYDVQYRVLKIFKMRLTIVNNGKRIMMANPRLMTTYHDLNPNDVRYMEPVRHLLQQKDQM